MTVFVPKSSSWTSAGAPWSGFVSERGISRLRYPQIWAQCDAAFSPLLGRTGNGLVDYSGRRRTGTLVGPTWTAWEWLLNGSSDYISCSVDNRNRSYTIAAWIYLLSLPILDVVIIGGDGYGAYAPGAGFSVASPSGSNIVLYSRHLTPVPAYSDLSSSVIPLTVGKWCCVAISYDYVTQGVTFYFNGLPCGTGTHTQRWSVAPQFEWGRNRYPAGSPVEFLNGRMRDLFVFPRVLNAAEHRVLGSYPGALYECARQQLGVGRSLSLASPRSGDWIVGDTKTISVNKLLVDNHKILRAEDSGGTFPTTVASGIVGSDQAYTVAGPVGTHVRFRAESDDGGPDVTSDTPVDMRVATTQVGTYPATDLVDAPTAYGPTGTEYEGTGVNATTLGTILDARGVTAANKAQTFDGGLLLDYNGTCRVAGSPTTSQIQLGTDASSADNWYNGAVIKITGGTGAGQARRINGYVGSTRMATVHAPWVTPPDATSTVIVLGQIIT